MTWLRIDDLIADHPKFLTAGPKASWLWVCGLAYASRYLTDGFVPSVQVRTLGSITGAPKLASRLVAAGLWTEVEGGYLIHDYLDFQPSSADIKEAREATRRRKQRQRGAPVSRRTEGVTEGARPADVTPDARPRARTQAPPTPTPTPTPVNKFSHYSLSPVVVVQGVQGGADAPTTTTTERARTGKKFQETTGAPEALVVQPEHVELGRSLGLTAERVEAEAPRFVEYNRAHGGRAVDWSALFSIWLRRVPDVDLRRPAEPPNGPAEPDERPVLPSDVRTY